MALPICRLLGRNDAPGNTISFTTLRSSGDIDNRIGFDRAAAMRWRALSIAGGWRGPRRRLGPAPHAPDAAARGVDDRLALRAIGLRRRPLPRRRRNDPQPLILGLLGVDLAPLADGLGAGMQLLAGLALQRDDGADVDIAGCLPVDMVSNMNLWSANLSWRKARAVRVNASASVPAFADSIRRIVSLTDCECNDAPHSHAEAGRRQRWRCSCRGRRPPRHAPPTC